MSYALLCPASLQAHSIFVPNLPPCALPLNSVLVCRRFETRGVPGPTSKLSPRAPAQMGRRETEREGGRKPEGDGRERWNPAAFVFVPRPGRVRLQ
jgi:hypothetical protein